MMKPAFLLFLLSGALFAQNHDLGVMLGVSDVRTTVAGTHVSTAVGAHIQINYAAQLKETGAGRLYLELPMLVGGRVSSSIQNGVYASNGVILYFTPGVRWNLPVHSRLSLYGAAGAGLAGFGGNQVSIAGNRVTASNGFTADFAGAVGGGLDVRLSRLMSLRGEVRDFITRAGQGGVAGHNHVVYGFGVGFHW